jgi:membrane protease YdiL (CAAX protease family)
MIITCIPLFIVAVRNQFAKSGELIAIAARQIIFSLKDVKHFLLTVVGVMPVYLFDLTFSKFVSNSFLSILVISFLIPISEEISFRLVLPRIFRTTGKKWIDATIFSIFFAVMHFFDTGSALALATTFAFSMYCYYLVFSTGKILYPIIFHILWNFQAISFSV